MWLHCKLVQVHQTTEELRKGVNEFFLLILHYYFTPSRVCGLCRRSREGNLGDESDNKCIESKRNKIEFLFLSCVIQLKYNPNCPVPRGWMEETEGARKTSQTGRRERGKEGA